MFLILPFFLCFFSCPPADVVLSFCRVSVKGSIGLFSGVGREAYMSVCQDVYYFFIFPSRHAASLTGGHDTLRCILLLIYFVFKIRVFGYEIFYSVREGEGDWGN